MKLLKRIVEVLLCTVVLLIAIFLIGRYGWKLVGFHACTSAGIERVIVEEKQVQIDGFYPGSFPKGFLGYYAEQVDNTLYVGFKFSSLFGIFETGHFEIAIPTEGTVSLVVIKTNEHEYSIWSEEEEWNSEETEILAVPTGYEQILVHYRTALKENWDEQQLINSGLNPMVRNVDPGTVGYTVIDLDDNGLPEFVIGTISGDDFYEKLIFDLYTVDKDGEEVQVFRSIERDYYYYAGSNRFANLCYFSDADSFVTTLKFEDTGLDDMTFITAPTECVQMKFVSIVE